MLFVGLALTAILVLAVLGSTLDRTLGWQKPAAGRNNKKIIVGAARDFFVYDYSKDKKVSVKLTCVKISRHAIIYKEPSVGLPKDIIDRIGTEFDEDIYPVNRRLLAPPALMGLTGENRVTILLLDEFRGRPANAKAPSVNGYYSQENERLQVYQSESNQAKLINIFVSRYNVSGDDVMTTVAHEIWHLTNWAQTRNNVGLIIGGLFAFATVLTLYLGLSHLYLRSFIT
jgi:hypothetical protein